MVTWENLGFFWLLLRGRKLGLLVHFFFGLWFCLAVLKPVAALRPLRERARSWGDEVGNFYFFWGLLIILFGWFILYLMMIYNKNCEFGCKIAILIGKIWCLFCQSQGGEFESYVDAIMR